MAAKRILLAVGFGLLVLGVFAVPYATRQVTAWVSPQVAVRLHGFHLEESGRDLGIEFRHERSPLDARVEHVGAIVFYGGASVSITDVNNDGWPDMYVTTSRFGAKNRLYLNRGGTRFEDVAERAGIADVNTPEMGASFGSAWGDYDNDGHEDLLLLRFGYLELFRNNGDLTFTRVTPQAGLASQWIYASDAVWFDLDRDGCLDFFVGANYRPDQNLWKLSTSRIYWESVTGARNGGPDRLYRQDRVGDRCAGTFREVARQYGVDDPGWTISVGAADLDGDGWPDLYVANDVGPDVAFTNVSGSGFKHGFTGIGDDTKKGMNVAFGDFRNSGRLSVYVANITKQGYLVEGNMLWENLGGGRFHEVAWEVGAADGGWGWGAQFGDLNNDGHQDIFAVNGMVSGDPKQEYWYELGVISRGGSMVLEDFANWLPLGRKSLQGHERSHVFLNDGKGRFREVAESIGVTGSFDGRGVALADLDRNGSLDVIVANQLGPLLVYRNRVDPDRKWIQFRLRGTQSNRSGIGAQVTLYWNDQRQLQENDGRTGFAGHGEKLFHFGLGKAPTLHRAEIRWPSGRRQTLTGLEVNKLYVVDEPAG